jgi:hypothetical protein
LDAPDPRFVVNVEVFLHPGDRWLLIRRGDPEAHAPGTLAGVGGKVEAPGLGPEAPSAHPSSNIVGPKASRHGARRGTSNRPLRSTNQALVGIRRVIRGVATLPIIPMIAMAARSRLPWLQR